MAAAPTPPPAPPGAGGPPASSQQAAAAPPQPSPQLEKASRVVIMIVQGLRSIGQDFPQTQPVIQEINDLMRTVQLKMMTNVQPAQPAAPPVNG